MNLRLEPMLKVSPDRVFSSAVAHDLFQEFDMAKQDKDFNRQQQQSKPPRVDEVAKQKQKAEEEEVAGRHKNDGQEGHKGNR
ncbi:MAG: hypothetical protein ACXWHC_09405 [Usitatibacter sp.]